MPVLGFFYLVGAGLFSDTQATMENGEEYLVPKQGIPSMIAGFYAVNSILWGDYRYLDMNRPLEINFFQFIQLWWWSFFQLATSAMTLMPFLVWSAIGSFTLFNILWYEVAFVSRDPENPADDDKPVLPDPDDADWI